MQDQQGLSVLGKQQQIGFPVPGLTSIIDRFGSFLDGNPLLDVLGRAAALASAEPPLALGPGQIQTPGIVLGPGDLSRDEAVDALVADLPAVLGQSPRYLLRRLAPPQAAQDLALEFGTAQQATPPLAPGPGLLPGIDRLIALGTGVALQFPRDARWRAIQS